MKIWLLQSSEPMPVLNPNMRLLRTGMMAEKLTERGHEVIWFNNSFDHFTKKQMVKNDTVVKECDRECRCHQDFCRSLAHLARVP